MKSNSVIQINPAKLKGRLVELIPLRKPVLVTGRPGIGKTDIINGAVKELNYEILTDFPVVSDPTDYKGLPFAQVNSAAFLPIGILKKILEAVKPTVVFFDDLGQAPGSVQAAIMQLILARQINGHKIPDCVTFVAATNRREDKAGVSGFIEPLKSRFFIFELEMKLEDWVNWALNIPSFPIALIACVRFRPQWVESWEPSKGIENTPNPRNIAELGSVMAHGLEGVDLYASRLGEAAAVELSAFLSMYQNLPNVSEITMNPSGAVVPVKPDAQHAITIALASRANNNTFAPMCEYIERLPVEFGALFMKDIAIRKRELTEEAPYMRWASKNGKLLTV